MIKSFADKQTAAIFRGQFVKGLPKEIQVRAGEKLQAIDAAASLETLRVRLQTGSRPCAVIGRGSMQFG